MMSRGTSAGSLLLLCLSLIASVYGGRYSGGVLNLPGPPLGENFEGALTLSLLAREPARSVDAMLHVPIVDNRSRNHLCTLLKGSNFVYMSHVRSPVRNPRQAWGNYAGDVWALLIAGSAGWGNYRHQADVLHVRIEPPHRAFRLLFALLVDFHDKVSLSKLPGEIAYRSAKSLLSSCRLTRS